MGSRFVKALLVFTVILAGVFLVYSPVHAALVPCGRSSCDKWDSAGTKCLVPTPPEEMRPCTTCDIFALGSRVINFVLFTVVPAVAVLFYLIGGLMILLGGANPGLVATGKSFFWNTTRGLVIIFGAWMITNTVLKSLVGDNGISNNWFRIECTNPPQLKPPSTQTYFCSSENRCVTAPSGTVGKYTTSDCNNNECQRTGGTLSITTTNLPDATVGQEYNHFVTVSGGATPYTFYMASGDAPPGLDLHEDGSVSGTPTTTGQFTFTVEVNDSSAPAQSATEIIKITVKPAGSSVNPLKIETRSLPDGAVGKQYSQPIRVSGGTTPYTFYMASGDAPPGLDLHEDGSVSGIPTTTGQFTFTVEIDDSSVPNPFIKTQDFTLEVTAVATVPPLTISTVNLPDAIIGADYSQPLVVEGGTTPYTYSTVGPMPAGLNLLSSGSIAGKPITAGVYVFTFYVEDSTSPTKKSVTKQLSIKVVTAAAGVVISNVAASNITATGATITWTTDKPSTSQVEYGTSSSFGSSTTIDNTPKTNHSVTVTGLIPNTAYSYRAKSSVTGFNAVSSTNTFRTIATAVTLSITTSSLPDGLAGREGYGRQVEASGGTTPYAFSISTGSLPPGLIISANGIISGTPTTAGTYNFTIRVEDSSSPKKAATKPLSIKVNSTLSCLFDGVNLCQGQSLKLSGGKLVPNTVPACGVSRCSQYVSAINDAASKTGISANLLKATMFKESACLVSAANTTVAGGESYGLMQMQPGTANTFSQFCPMQNDRVSCTNAGGEWDTAKNKCLVTPAWLKNPTNAATSICIAAYFYKSLADGACGYSPRNILAGYSAGPGRCQASRDCANDKSCDGGTVRQWECLYDNPQHTVCNGDNTVIGPSSKLNETRFSVVNKLYCVDHPGF